ncbi:MAG: CvpA family protein [Candidatus Delongbacteria bacterium]|nr:CvpA family protein [Candidatus Delongbacteria bacterium]MCG2759868.1 CvpA family protein [Candidatus Delongbacteria bacterium]
MNLMPFVILILMFFVAINGKNRGIVNYKFSIEKIVLTLVIMPSSAIFIKEKLIAFMPDLLAAIIGVISSLLIIFLILTFVLSKITKIPEYEYTSADKMLGFFAGLLKGFCIMAFFIMFYGVSFLDRVEFIPDAVDNNFRDNFINARIENSIEYYRKSVYSVYAKTTSAGVEDLYKKKGASSVVDLSGYTKWAQSSFAPKQEAEEADKTEKTEDK